MLTSAFYGPFDLSDALSASVTYHLWGSTEWDGTNNCPYDRFTVWAFTDVGNYYYSYHCGNWTNGGEGNGYFRDTIDLPSLIGPGQGNAWLKLEFSSDQSEGDIGIHVDDITLSVLRPTPTPRVPHAYATSTTTKTPTATQIAAPTADSDEHPPTRPQTHHYPTSGSRQYRGPLDHTGLLPITMRAHWQRRCAADKADPRHDEYTPGKGKRLTTINAAVAVVSKEMPPFVTFGSANKGHRRVALTGIPSGRTMISASIDRISRTTIQSCNIKHTGRLLNTSTNCHSERLI